MGRVVVAPLGMHPAVVTAAYRALVQEGWQPDRLILLYPGLEEEEDQDGRWIAEGAELVASELGNEVVKRFPLPYPDPNSRDLSGLFLEYVSGILDQCEQQYDEVVVLLAGGRKNMTFLCSVAAAFYPCVKRLLHAITEERLYSIEELCQLVNTERQQALFPQINLFDVPFTHVADAVALRKWLSRKDYADQPPVEMTSTAEDFYRMVFGRRDPGRLELSLTESAFIQLSELHSKDFNTYAKIRDKLVAMQDREALYARRHGTFSDAGRTLHFYKERRTAERPFFYTRPEPIHLGDKANVKSVVVVGCSVEREGKYDKDKDYWIKRGDYDPVHQFRELPVTATSLIAPLGLSPMVVPQAVLLLREREGLHVDRVRVVYPQGNGEISNGVRYLKEVEAHLGVKIELIGVPGLEDVASTEDCRAFTKALERAVRDEKHKYPDRTPQLLISGGRKAMVACGVLAAQHSGLSGLYHTTIPLPADENRIEKETSLEALGRMTRDERLRHLTLQPYPLSMFDLFSVPVVLLAGR
jgi:hypothetical protein